MRPEGQETASLWDMLQAAKAVNEFVSGRPFAEYERDLMLRSAVERQIEIIGEAARKVSAAFRRSQPNIPWSGIISQRHVLAHEYGEIRNERIWRVAMIDVPELIKQLEPLVPEPPATD